jgi:hypothetical protein
MQAAINGVFLMCVGTCAARYVGPFVVLQA